MATLIVFSGLPGVGKTTIARRVSESLEAVYLRIDTIEQAIRSAGVLTDDVGTAGYDVALALAKANLKLGQTIVAGCVNPLPVSRSAWQVVASASTAAILNVEVICSDVAEHRRRVETRVSDIPGHLAPTWEEVTRHDYEPWSGGRLVVDTANVSPDDAVTKVLLAVLELE